MAQDRLDEVARATAEMGAEADGEVGDRDPVMAVRDALRGREVDEIIVSTLPKGLSRWLGEDVPSRLREAVAVPVTVVTQRGLTATGRAAPGSPRAAQANSRPPSRTSSSQARSRPIVVALAVAREDADAILEPGRGARARRPSRPDRRRAGRPGPSRRRTGCRR